MSSRDQQHGPFTALVPLWLLLVVAVVSAVVGVGVGQSGLVSEAEQTSIGRAVILDEDSYLTRFEAREGDVALEFNARSVPWTDGTTYDDGLLGAPVGCLVLQQEVAVEITYTEIDDRDLVLHVECL